MLNYDYHVESDFDADEYFNYYYKEVENGIEVYDEYGELLGVIEGKTFKDYRPCNDCPSANNPEVCEDCCKIRWDIINDQKLINDTDKNI